MEEHLGHCQASPRLSLGLGVGLGGLDWQAQLLRTALPHTRLSPSPALPLA